MSAAAGDLWTPSERELERRRIRSAQRMRGLGIGATATILVVALASFAITRSAGWPRVQETFLSWQHASAAFGDIAKGFALNVMIFLIAEPCILLIGTGVAIARNTRSPWLAPVRLAAIVYTDVFRGLPTLLVVILFGFGLPALELTGVPTNPIALGTIALILCYGAYVAEVIRAGIDSIHPSQLASAEALALSRSQTMRFVVLPQAVRRVVPPLLNDFVSLQKDTALVSTLGVFEAMFAAQDYGNFNFNYTPMLVAGLFFLVLTVPMARFTDWLAKRAEQRERGR